MHFKSKTKTYLVLISISMSIFFVYSGPGNAWAQSILWLGNGDAVSFEDAANWLPVGVPNPGNDVELTINKSNIIVSESFKIRSLSIGGKSDINLLIDDFVIGEIAPEENTDVALYIRHGANVVLKGDGQIRLNGSFKNSEETLITSPAFMFMAE